MSDQQKRSSVAVLLIAGAVLLPLYVLSIGPATWLWVNGYLPTNVYIAAYFPLHECGDAWQPLGDAIRYWERVWIGPPTPIDIGS